MDVWTWRLDSGDWRPPEPPAPSSTGPWGMGRNMIRTASHTFSSGVTAGGNISGVVLAESAAPLELEAGPPGGLSPPFVQRNSERALGWVGLLPRV